QRQSGQLLKAPAAGGSITQVTAWLEITSGMVVTDDAIYVRESDPPETLRTRLTRVDKATGERQVVSLNAVATTPVAHEGNLYYFERNADVLELWQHSAALDTRVLQLELAGSGSPTLVSATPTRFVWCETTASSVRLWNWTGGDTVPTSQTIEGEQACPPLAMLGERVIAFSAEQSALVELSDSGRRVLASELETAGADPTLVPVAGEALLVAELNTQRILLVNSAGEQLWSRKLPFPISVRPATSERRIYVAGNLGLLRFEVPVEPVQ